MHPRKRSLARRILRWLIALWALGSVVSRASAQSHDYCEKVKARAGSEAALMLAPKLFGQMLRFPANVETAAIGLGPVPGNFQLRVGLGFSALEAYRGLGLSGVADADCRARSHAELIQHTIDTTYDAVQLVAFRAQRVFLEQRAAVWNEVLERARKRLEANVITNLDFEQVRARTNEIEARLEQLRAQIEQLEVRGVSLPEQGLSELVRYYQSAELEREERLSSAKSLSAWNMTLSGGALVPMIKGASLDWFGWVELSYNLGGLWSSSHEHAYLKARRSELQTARYELVQRVRVAERELRSHGAHAEQQLSLLEGQLRFLDRTIASLETADVSATAHARDNLVLERVLDESERVLWQALITTLKGLGYASHG